MIQNLLNRTIINYVLVVIGTAVATKIGIPGDIWELVRGGLEEAVVAAVGGGGVVAVILAAARGIADSNKTKAAVNGKQVNLEQLANSPSVPRSVQTEAKQIVDKTRSLVDILSGK